MQTASACQPLWQLHGRDPINVKSAIRQLAYRADRAEICVSNASGDVEGEPGGGTRF